MTVIQDPAELHGDKLIPQSTDIPIESQAFKIDMGSAQDCSTRRLITSPGFDTDKSVLDDIDPSDTVFPSQCVQGKEYFDGIGVALFLVGDGNLDGQTGLELDGDAFRGLGGVFGSDGELPHVGGRSDVGIFENSSFVGDVEEVFIGGPRFGSGLRDGDGFFGGVSEEGLTAGEAVVEFW